MKKSLLFIIIVLLVKISFSQNIVFNPKFESTSHELLQINKIIFHKDVTVVECSIYAEEGWFCIDKSYYILGLDDSIKYKLRKSEGMPLCPTSHEFHNDTVNFLLYFETVSRNNSYINIIEDCDNACVKIEKILIDSEIIKIDEAYSEIERLYQQKNYKLSIEIAQEILPIIKDTTSLRYGQILSLLADSYLWSKDLDNAEYNYQKILNSGLIDSTETGIFMYPFANFKNKACQGMAYVYEYKEDWDKSIEWLDSLNNYHYYTFSYTHRLKHNYHILEWYIFLYEKKKDYNKAVHTGMEFIIYNFNGQGQRNYHYNKANQRLESIITENFDKEQFKKDLDKSLDEMVLTVEDSIASANVNFYGHNYILSAHLNQKDIVTKEGGFGLGQELKEKNLEYFRRSFTDQLFYERIQLMNGRSLQRIGDKIYYKDEIYTGDFYEYWNNGNIQTKGSIAHGDFTGEFIFYYENGNIQSAGLMKNNSETGRWSYFYDNNGPEREGEYIDGQMNGKWIFWYPSGQQNIPIEITEGSMAGFSFNAVDENSLKLQRKVVMSFVNDLEDGKCSVWHPNGELYKKGEYVNGKKDGKWKEWDEDGNVFKEAKYEAGILLKGDEIE